MQLSGNIEVKVCDTERTLKNISPVIRDVYFSQTCQPGEADRQITQLVDAVKQISNIYDKIIRIYHFLCC